MASASSSSTAVSTFWTRAALVPATLPAVLYVRDCYVGLTRIKGSSMEPTLRDGDIVVVRKCDAGTVWQAASSLWNAVRSTPHQDAVIHVQSDESNDEVDRAEALRFQRLQGIQSHGAMGWLATSRPPLILPGHVLLYQNPVSLKKEYHIKRVVGVGGQWVRVLDHATPRQVVSTDRDGNETTRTYYDHRLIALPVHSVYVEGDNSNNSVDSRTMGPISYNLVVGVAEYIIWPPSRWQRLPRQPVYDVEGSPRAIWY